MTLTVGVLTGSEQVAAGRQEAAEHAMAGGGGADEMHDYMSMAPGRHR